MKRYAQAAEDDPADIAAVEALQSVDNPPAEEKERAEVAEAMTMAIRIIESVGTDHLGPHPQSQKRRERN